MHLLKSPDYYYMVNIYSRGDFDLDVNHLLSQQTQLNAIIKKVFTVFTYFQVVKDFTVDRVSKERGSLKPRHSTPAWATQEDLISKIRS